MKPVPAKSVAAAVAVDSAAAVVVAAAAATVAAAVVVADSAAVAATAAIAATATAIDPAPPGSIESKPPHFCGGFFLRAIKPGKGPIEPPSTPGTPRKCRLDPLNSSRSSRLRVKNSF